MAPQSCRPIDQHTRDCVQAVSAGLHPRSRSESSQATEDAKTTRDKDHSGRWQDTEQGTVRREVQNAVCDTRQMLYCSQEATLSTHKSGPSTARRTHDHAEDGCRMQLLTRVTADAAPSASHTKAWREAKLFAVMKSPFYSRPVRRGWRDTLWKSSAPRAARGQAQCDRRHPSTQRRIAPIRERAEEEGDAATWTTTPTSSMKAWDEKNRKSIPQQRAKEQTQQLAKEPALHEFELPGRRSVDPHQQAES